jgi:hypothetical protein
MNSANTNSKNANRAVAGPGDWKYDLAVAYRIYPKVSGPAQSLPFADDKLFQAEIFLRSFRNSLGSLRVKIWAILDGCPREYCALFQRYFSAEDLVIVDHESVGNQPTFEEQLDILISQDEAEFVYFAEDDYLYLPEQFPLMLKFLRGRQDCEFVSPYDHPNCYFLEAHREPKWVTMFEGHHWRTASSTCLTFLTRRSTLARYERVFRTYARGNDDFALWLSLTKRQVFQPLASLRYFFRREFYWKVLVKSWLYCWPQILFGRTARLWVPIPGIATHWCAGLLSPGFDWITLMRSEASRTEALPVSSTTHSARVGEAP